MSQSTYSVDSSKYIVGQVADTSLKQIDSFQLVNKSPTVRSYLRPGDVVIRAAQGTNSTSQVILRGEAVTDLTIGKVIGIVTYDPSYGLEWYQSMLSTDQETDLIYRDIISIVRKGRIVVRVAEAVVAGEPAFPVPITTNFDTATATYRNDNSGQVTLVSIGVFVTSAAAVGDLAVVEINFSN